MLRILGWVGLFLCLLIQNWPTDGHLVVFEEVGQVATSLSYTHVAIPLDLPKVGKSIKDCKELIIRTFFNIMLATPKIGEPSDISDSFSAHWIDLMVQ